jgi:hypothetical protein
MPRQRIQNAIRTLCILAILGITPAYAQNNFYNFVPDAQKVGEGRYTYLFLNIYDAALYAPQGAWDNDKPFALQLSYLRTFNGKRLADSSAKEIRRQGFTDEVKLATWHAQMRKIFPDVDRGVSLTGVYTETGGTIFYRDDIEIGRIDDPEFSRAFFSIWLDEKTSAPDLRRKLLGAT